MLKKLKRNEPVNYKIYKIYIIFVNIWATNTNANELI